MSRRTRSEWFSGGSLWGSRRSTRKGSMRSNTRRLRVEPLEDRRMLAAVTVNTNHNSVNGNTTSIAALIATPGADGISFPEALMAANNTAGEDTITLASSLANHDINHLFALNTINVVQLAITDDVIIQGPKEGPAILQGPAMGLQQFMGEGRILDIAANVNVSIEGLWFQRGDVVDTPDNSNTFGGAIRNAGNLTLRDCTFYNNYAGASDVVGGGGGGAAVSNTGTLTVDGCSFAANMAVYGSGGAIYNAGTATVTNSTFYSNWTGYSGGAIFNASGGTLTVTNCTMLNNGSNGDPVLVWPIGSGSITNAGTMALNNTVVVRTTHGNDIENSGTISGSHNFIGDGSGGLANTLTGNPSVEAVVHEVGYFFLPESQDGARPFAFSPLPGSPLIGAGNNAAAPVFDQIGAPRINNGTVDIGAIEVAIAPYTIVVTTLADEDDGTIDPAVGGGTSLREALSLKLRGDATITFAPGLSGTMSITTPLAIENINAPGSQKCRGNMTIVGPGADVLTIDGQAVSAIEGGILRIAGVIVAISGLTFANGSAIDGGAIFGGQLTVTSCSFLNNTAAHEGAR